MKAARPESDWRVAALRVVAVVAAIYCATLLVLMGATALRMRLDPPLDTPELLTLRKLVREQPANEALREQVRALDTLARRAHFVGEQSLRVGGVLFLAGLGVWLLAAQGQRMLVETSPRPPPRDAGGEDQAAPSRRALLVAATVCLVLAVGLSLWRPRVGETVRVPEEAPPQPQPGIGMATDKSAPDVDDAVVASGWPMFRGPNGLGVASGVEPPLTWDGVTGSNVVWRVPMPRPGFNSPVVFGDRVFLSGGDKNLREVYAFDTATGALVWRHPVTDVSGSPAELPSVTDDTGYAAPTMTGDGRRLFALFATGDLLALDLKGNRLWARNLGAPDNPYGHASSLLYDEGRLFVQYDDADGGLLLALNVIDGRTVWRVARETELSWATPVLVQAGGRAQLVLNGNPIAAGYRPEDGTLLWSDDCMSGEVAVSPAFWDGTVFIANEYARLVALDLNADAARLWEAEFDLPDVSSPVAWSNRLWLTTAYGTVTCRDAASGERLWQHDFDDGFYASPVVAGGRVYLLDVKGVMHVLDAGSEFVKLAANPLGERSSCTGAFVGRRVYLRGNKHLFCLGPE